MLNLDTSPLTELSSVKNGELAYTEDKLYVYNNDAWYPVGYSEVKELVWEGTGCWWNATTPVGTFNIGLDTVYDDYELVITALTISPFTKVEVAYVALIPCEAPLTNHSPKTKLSAEK